MLPVDYLFEYLKF